ncbi:poly(ADP-ribose) glycohydrolase 1 isoform X1 [Vigna radiata var. radiata]|uniref:poly(ADP-ribose) glycohydrolase n=2 Tax=Vigna radiata var. radiata TaxID=3916 RepID=A0A1S3VTH7_VIGRR|nr:poly(ADP-ribose) glycohydrolase 1 isoform X1 [Vigna radiata var. radiata]
MEESEELQSILPYLPLLMRSSSLFWPSQAVETLRELGGGRVDSGRLLFQAISDLRKALSLSSQPLSPSTSLGYELFFDEVMSGEESRKWFQEVVPVLGNLLLRLPSLLETHYQNPHNSMRRTTALRLLDSQQQGIIFLSQELIAALLGCSFFCLFPVKDRYVNHLPMINFDELFASLYEDYSQKQENKIWCIIHYFQRISSKMPKGIVSFERKALHLKNDYTHISCPDANFWSTSTVPLCRFEVHNSGLIEDQSSEAVEVDFANKYLGGGALGRGCVQEEIRFMVSPELIAGMLFLPAMADNEAIEIVGVERFSSYTGYASSFRFSGDYVDEREVDALGRRKTRIVAIDALCSPGTRQYRMNFLLREINKAFCGFLYQCEYQLYQKKLQENGCSSALFDAATSTSMETSDGKFSNHKAENSQNDYHCMDQVDNIGVATGNWGCGAFGGDPELKTIIQWLASSQAVRPFIAYYTFGLEALQSLDEVAHWILAQRWTVGDLWNMLVEYSTSRSKGETNVGFLHWLLPSIYGHGTGIDLSNLA